MQRIDAELAVAAVDDWPDIARLELVGLDRAAPQASNLVREIEAAIQAASIDGETAGRVAESRYALLRGGDADREALAGSVRALATRFHQRVEAAVSQTPVASEVDPMASLRAMRFTLDSFLAGGGRGDASAQMTFTGAVMRTLKEAEDFRVVVAKRRFALNFQPVVKLTSRQVQHYEVLARFAPDQSPAGVIRMAEELGLITDFDLAVADQLRTRLDAAVEDEVEALVFLDRCDFIDSTGIALLLKTRERLARKGRRLAIRCPSVRVARTLEMTGLDLDGLIRESAA